VLQKVERKKILVIVTETEMQIFLANFLDADGFEILASEGTPEELKKLKESKPALIILDAMIPKAGALKVYRELKTDEVLKKIPIIMLSTIDQKILFQCDQGRGPKVGRVLPEPDAYLEKPPEAEELMNLIRTLTKESPD